MGVKRTLAAACALLLLLLAGCAPAPEKPGEVQYMTDILPAYEMGSGFGSDTLKEYSAIKSGGTESFNMGGIKYLNGFTLYNSTGFIAGSTFWAVWNLNGQYSSFTATLGHVDGSENDSTRNPEDLRFDIFCDGVLRDSFYVKDDMLPKTVNINLTGVMQLKIVPHGYNGHSYGFGNPVLN